jgi:hypothetical protein
MVSRRLPSRARAAYFGGRATGGRTFRPAASARTTERGFDVVDVVESHRASSQTGLRRDHAPGRMVDPARGRRSGLPGLHRLLDVGGAARSLLLLRKPPVAVLLAGALVSGGRAFGARALRGAAGMVARVPAVFARDGHSVGARELPAHLLLLPWRVLQVVLAGTAFVLGRNARDRLVFLSLDVWHALWFATPGGGEAFGLSIGTLVLATNTVLLGSYTFGCHSLRHLVGGGIDRLARRPVRRTAYECVSWCNKSHMRFAWFSLVWVGFSDVYVRLCAMGIWSDLRIF